MNGKNLKYFVMGAAIVATGLWATAVNIPNNFAAGDVLSAGKLNANFAAVKTAVDALEAPNSVTTAKIADSAVSTAKVADGAINAAKTADESGFNAAEGDNSIVAIPATRASVKSVSLEAPAAGFAVVTVDLNLQIAHTTGTTTGAEFNLSKTADAGSSTDLENLRVVTIPGTWPSGTLFQTFSMSKVFTVTGGTNTFHLNALRASGTAGSLGFRGIRMTVTFMPTRYGTGATVN